MPVRFRMKRPEGAHQEQWLRAGCGGTQHAFNPSTRKQRQENLCEFAASLAHTEFFWEGVHLYRDCGAWFNSHCTKFTWSIDAFFCECHVAQAAPKFLNLLPLPPKCWKRQVQGPKPLNARHSFEHIHSAVSILSLQEGTWTLESCVPPPTVNLFPVSVDLIIHETVTWYLDFSVCLNFLTFLRFMCVVASSIQALCCPAPHHLEGCTQAEPWPAQGPMVAMSLHSLCMCAKPPTLRDKPRPLSPFSRMCFLIITIALTLLPFLTGM